MEDRIMNTKVAHQKYSNPLVGIIIFLTAKESKVAVFRDENGIWKLPEMFARGDETIQESAHRIMSDYVNKGSKIDIEHYVLLSGENFRQDAYQFNFIVFASLKDNQVTFKREINWVSSKTFLNLDIYDNYRRLLQTFFSEGYLQDRFVVPEDLSKRRESDPKRLMVTKKIHAEHFPMPLITVDGLLLKFSKEGEFEGIILEKRAKTVEREPNKWALPAGFVKAHERMSEALAYEVFEETGTSLREDLFLSVYKIDTSPHRDPKWFVWTEFLVAFTTEDLPEVPYTALKEIETVKIFPLDNLPPKKQIAFDHAEILTEFRNCVPSYVTRAKNIIERGNV